MKQIIEQLQRSIEIAKELNIKKYTIVRDGYSISVKIKRCYKVARRWNITGALCEGLKGLPKAFV